MGEGIGVGILRTGGLGKEGRENVLGRCIAKAFDIDFQKEWMLSLFVEYLLLFTETVV